MVKRKTVTDPFERYFTWKRWVQATIEPNAAPETHLKKGNIF